MPTARSKFSKARSKRAGSRPASPRDPFFAAVQDSQRVRVVRRSILAWGEERGRHFFWRDPTTSPFAILVCEILLSKTRAEIVETVARAVLERYPRADSLAKARRGDLQRLLYPLGLHRKRARQLVECAKLLVNEHRGEVPDTFEDLMSLPSIGRYAANAIASVAFDERRAVLDANVSRIYQRVFALPTPPERLSVAHDFWDFATRVLPRSRAKAFNWAVLDLGGTVCSARAPDCDACPLSASCNFAATNLATTVRTAKSPRGTRARVRPRVLALRTLK